jgi:anti-sigma factor RsiW
VALLGGGLGFELWAESTYDAARAEMTRQSRRSSLEDSANTRRYVAEALAATGLVAGGAAVWLYLRARNGEHGPETGARVLVVPTRSGLAVSGRF